MVYLPTMTTSVKNDNMDLKGSLWGLISLILTIGLVGPPLFIVMISAAFIKKINPKTGRSPDHFFCAALQLILRLQPWHNLSLKNFEQLPASGCIYVANHRSTLDVFLFLSLVPGIKVVSKRSLFNIPILGTFMRVFEHVPINVKDLKSINHAVGKLNAHIEKGRPILYFPEMTRCEKGAKSTGKFVNLPFTLANNHQIKLIPVGILKTDLVWPKGSFQIYKGSQYSMTSLGEISPGEFDSPVKLKEHVKQLIDNFLITGQYDH